VILRGALTGFISGSIMGLAMKCMEAIFSKKIYILLLNVDFIPYTGSRNFPEFVEFLFHVLLAGFIGIIFACLMERKANTQKSPHIWSFLLTLPTVFLYFPLTILAKKETPPVDDLISFALWTIGHILFAILLPIFYFPKPKQNKEDDSDGVLHTSE
jgi:drug/metabolite transporter (DMT)-like permease